MVEPHEISKVNSELENKKPGTNQIQKTSINGIKDNFLQRHNMFVKENWNFICKHSSRIKSILQIPELQDITIEDIKDLPNEAISIITSTNFNGNLAQIILDKKLPNEITRFIDGAVIILLNNGSLQLSIRQKKLSS